MGFAKVKQNNVYELIGRVKVTPSLFVRERGGGGREEEREAGEEEGDSMSFPDLSKGADAHLLC